jgi:spermidine synthase
VIDDGRRWLNRHPALKYDAIVQNTTWYYRPNVANLLSREYLALAAAHLSEGGVIMYNTTGSTRAQRTACATFPNGVRLTNMMVLSPVPMAIDSNRLRGTLVSYRINGRPVLDIADPKQRERLGEIVAALAPPPPGRMRPAEVIEDCAGVLARTQGMLFVTDDNMGEEWTAMVTTDPLLRRLQGLRDETLRRLK